MTPGPAKEVVISSVIVAKILNESFFIPILVQCNDKDIKTQALLDTGALGTFMDKDFAERNGIPLTPLAMPMTVRNMDGTPNIKGKMTHYTWVNVTVAGESLQTRFLISHLATVNMILGIPWIRQVNLKINWEKGTIDIKLSRMKHQYP